MLGITHRGVKMTNIQLKRSILNSFMIFSKILGGSIDPLLMGSLVLSEENAGFDWVLSYIFNYNASNFRQLPPPLHIAPISKSHHPVHVCCVSYLGNCKRTRYNARAL